MRSTTKDKANLHSDRVVFRHNPTNEKTSNYLSVLQTALTNFSLTKIAYQSEGNKKETVRTIEPFAVFSTQGNWILVAYCRLRKDFRAFRLDRIKQLTTLNDNFKPHKITLQDYFEKCREKYFQKA